MKINAGARQNRGRPYEIGKVQNVRRSPCSADPHASFLTCKILLNSPSPSCVHQGSKASYQHRERTGVFRAVPCLPLTCSSRNRKSTFSLPCFPGGFSLAPWSIPADYRMMPESAAKTTCGHFCANWDSPKPAFLSQRPVEPSFCAASGLTVHSGICMLFLSASSGRHGSGSGASVWLIVHVLNSYLHSLSPF